jgi:serine/threonine protein kinase
MSYDLLQGQRDALPVGTSLNGYRIDSVLGRGGFGITYCAVDLLEQPFAIKEFFPRQFARRAGTSVTVESDSEIFEDCRQRFLREARLLAGLSRTGEVSEIVRVITCFEANNTAYSVMEMLPGETLEEHFRREPAGIAAEELTAALRGILMALVRVHEAGILHRDIKPANIIMHPDGRPVLIDFGSARDFRANVDTSFTQIFSGGYAPVEQLVGSQQGRFSDLYSVGAVAYRGIGGTLIDALTRHQAVLSNAPDPLTPAIEAGRGRYSPRLLAAIDYALAMAIGDRPQRAEDLLVALDDSLGMQQPPEPDPSAPAIISVDSQATAGVRARPSFGALSGYADVYLRCVGALWRKWLSRRAVLVLAAISIAAAGAVYFVPHFRVAPSITLATAGSATQPPAELISPPSKPSSLEPVGGAPTQAEATITSSNDNVVVGEKKATPSSSGVEQRLNSRPNSSGHSWHRHATTSAPRSPSPTSQPPLLRSISAVMRWGHDLVSGKFR